jgi:hypothetical protein
VRGSEVAGWLNDLLKVDPVLAEALTRHSLPATPVGDEVAFVPGETVFGEYRTSPLEVIAALTGCCLTAWWDSQGQLVRFSADEEG